jgi:RNA polymerase sigma factor (TIGR02999 family)
VTAPTANSITGLLQQWSEGDSAAIERLVPLVYGELRLLARGCLAGERSDHTLQSTALVHEAYLRLIKGSTVHWQNRAHFFAVAAQVMRRILVDHARKRGAAKRGADPIKLKLDGSLDSVNGRELDLVSLDDALNELAELDARQSRIVELRFFGGLSIENVAQVLAISPATVKREWNTARAWLFEQMDQGKR